MMMMFMIDVKWMDVISSDGESGQVEVVGQADQGDAIKTCRRADAQGRTACQSFYCCLKLSNSALFGCFVYSPWAIKKRATFIFTITLANVDRFQ